MATNQKKIQEDFTIFFNRYKGFSVVIFELIIAIAAINYYFIPKFNEITQLRSTIEQQSAQREDLASYASYLEELASYSLEVEEGLVNYALPSDNDIISLIVTYEGLKKFDKVVVSPLELSPGLIRKDASKTSSSLGNPSVSTSTDTVPQAGSSDVESVDFSMIVEAANAEAANAFIDEIYKVRRTFDILNLDWANTDSDKVNVNLSMATYYFPNPTVVSSPDLVREGQQQSEFINKLKDSKVYEDLVLDGVDVGKEDLFHTETGSSPVQPTPQPTLPEEETSTESAILSMNFH